MGVYIKGMKMPNSCTGCERWADCPEVAWYMGEDFDFEDLIHSELDERRHGNCPLIEVSEPHGTLIDFDEIYWREEDGELIASFNTMKDMPTVIEAEGQ